MKIIPRGTSGKLWFYSNVCALAYPDMNIGKIIILSFPSENKHGGKKKLESRDNFLSTSLV